MFIAVTRPYLAKHHGPLNVLMNFENLEKSVKPYIFTNFEGKKT